MASESVGKSPNLLDRIRRSVSRHDGSSGGEENTATTGISERRREQIRRAQKSHRQRKTEQLQRLTAEVANLRTRDAANTAEIQRLQNTIVMLRQLLDQFGIPYELPDANNVNPQALVQVVEDASTQPPTQYLRISMPGSTSQSAVISSPIDINDAQIGVDFVLTLEQPCLHHHHIPSEEGDSINAHSAMMQAPIMARAPPLVTTDNKKPAHLPAGASWSVPSVELERLLYFSNQLRLPDEITPIQAWSHVQECTTTGWTPTKAELNALVEDLKPATVCYGFGAVLDQTSFQMVLDSYCPPQLNPL